MYYVNDHSISQKLPLIERGDNVSRKANHKGREIERNYDLALHALEPDNPYFLAALSKVRFSLKVSFGSNVSAVSTLPHL